MSFETGLGTTLHALHRRPWDDGPDGPAHPYDFRVEATVERGQLDERFMVIDLDVLQSALDAIVARLDGQDLDAIMLPEGAEAVTVEIMARWIHGELGDAVARAGADVLAIRVFESPDAYGGYRGPPSSA